MCHICNSCDTFSPPCAADNFLLLCRLRPIFLFDRNIYGILTSYISFFLFCKTLSLEKIFVHNCVSHRVYYYACFFASGITSSYAWAYCLGDMLRICMDFYCPRWALPRHMPECDEIALCIQCFSYTMGVFFLRLRKVHTKLANRQNPL